jgi:TolB-like protein/Flp pilus assembly protein TadD
VNAERPGFFDELKRRHVWRVAVAYAIAAWLLVQVATQLFPFFNIPNWSVRLVVLLLVIGFPVAVACAWVYELTPQGIRRTAPADSPDARPEAEHREIGRRLNAIIIAVLVLAVALLGWRLYAVRYAGTAAPAVAAAAGSPDEAKRDPGKIASVAPDSAAGAAASGLRTDSAPAPAASVPEKSVAVLPFANESGQQDEQFFSDGLSDDLINALSQFAGLKVISRNSAFQFRDSKDSSAEIGKLLGVAHLLEGSVQRAGDEVRITATLVNASDGTVVWSQRYDKPYKDLFALQDDITHSVADALKATLLTAPGAVVQSDRPPSGNLAAYAAYQHGVAYDALNTEAGARKAIAAYQQAIALDPKYSAAYAALSESWITLGSAFLGGAQMNHAYAKGRAAADAAMRSGPDSSLAYMARANVLAQVDFDWRGSAAAAQRALQLAPHDAAAKFRLASSLASQGEVRKGVSLARQALDSDPRHAGWYNWLGVFLTALGQLDAARQAIKTSIALQPRAADYHEQLVIVEILRGDAKGAMAAAKQESPGAWRDTALALAAQIGPDRAAADTVLQKLIADQAGVAAYQIAEVYALRKDPDNTFKWLDRALANHDPGLQYLLVDPFILRYRNDPRFAAFCKKVGLPDTTDAVAMK